MTQKSASTERAVELERVRIEVRGDKLYIWPNKKPEGAPVIVEAKRLDGWASRVYRECVL